MADQPASIILIMEIWIKIFAGLFLWWVFSVTLAFRKGVAVRRLEEEMPVLFMIPRWMAVCVLILCLVIVAPYIMLEPFKAVRDLYRSWKLKLISRRIRRMAKSKNDEVNQLLTKVADGLDELSKE